MSSLLNVKAYFDLDENHFNYEKDLVIIAGPTCVGKSLIAMELAKKINGVLINADSVQVYEDLKILSARPTEIISSFIILIALALLCSLLINPLSSREFINLCTPDFELKPRYFLISSNEGDTLLFFNVFVK